MSDSDKLKNDARDEAIEVLQKMLTEELDLISGCRSLCRLRHDIDVPDKSVWQPIVGFESETDDYPLGAVRQHYSKDKLQELDEEISPYIAECAPVIEKSCKQLLEILQTAS